MIEFRYLQPEDAVIAAAIHIEGQPGTVLTLLGHRFLVELYRAVCMSEWGEGIGAFDNGELVAQTAMAVSSEKFFAEFKWRYLWRVAGPVALAILRHPKIISHVIAGWNYAEQTHSPEREGDVIFLGVKRDYLRQGLAPDLVRHMFGWADAIGLTSANFMIEKRNRPIRWMISQLNNLYIAHEFQAYGREMLLYKVPIKDNLETAQVPQGQPHTPAHVYPVDYISLPYNPKPCTGARLAAGLLSLILAMLSSLHIYWAFGGTWGTKQVIPTTDNHQSLLFPSPAMTLSVAGALGAAMLTVWGRLGWLWGNPIPKWLFRGGMWGLGTIFLGRAIGDFKRVGFFKQVRQTEFAYWDSRLFSPLCLLLSWLAFIANRD